MFHFEELSNKQKYIIGGSITFIVVLIVLFAIVLGRRPTITNTPTPQTTPPYIQITPRELQGGSGGVGGIPRRPTQSPQQQESELQARTPIQGNGFLLTYNETTGEYDAFIEEPYNTSQEEVLLWITDKYPNIPLSQINFQNTSSTTGQLPYRGDGFTITQGQNPNSYLVYLSGTNGTAQTAAAEVINALAPESEPIVEYIPISETIPSITPTSPVITQSQTQNPSVSIRPTIPTNSYITPPREQSSTEILQDFFNIFDPGDINPVTLNESLNPTEGTNADASPTNPTDFPPNISVSPAPVIAGILGNTNLPYSSALKGSLAGCLSNKSIYQVASSYTGIPWEVLAGIHYTETGGRCSRNQSLVSGRAIGDVEPDVGRRCSSQDSGLGKPYPVNGGCAFSDLLDTAVYAGNHLKTKNTSGGPPRNHQELVRMISHYNGGGNQNCRGGTPYRYCPPLFYAEDDTYVFNKNPDGRHEVMYIRYCADGKTCAELGKPNPVHAVYGVLTIASAISTL